MKKIAVIVPMKNHSDLTMALLDSIYANDDYDLNYLTIYVADTGSSDIEKRIMKQYIKNSELDIRYIQYNYYNFAKINNDVIKHHIDKDTDLILLCNNDIQLINNALSKLVNVYETNENVGTVGSLLLFPDYTIQHGGIIHFYDNMNIAQFSHLLLKLPYNFNLKGNYNTWGNTGAFMFISYNDWKEIGGLNENYKDCFEDVELNLQLLLKGKKNITCYDSLCFHKESSTRKQAMCAEDIIRIRTFADNDELRTISENIRINLDKNNFKDKFVNI